jgi:YD repeat-containing protein
MHVLAEWSFTTFAYDQLIRKEKQPLPLNQSETWTYNSLGQLVQQNDFDGNIIQYTYQANTGRRSQKQTFPYNSGTADATITYAYDVSESDCNRHDTVTDSCDGTIDSSYDVEGRLVSLVTPQGTV